ncbi:MAG: thioredoxin family protein [Methylovirgula sp.]
MNLFSMFCHTNPFSIGKGIKRTLVAAALAGGSALAFGCNSPVLAHLAHAPKTLLGQLAALQGAEALPIEGEMPSLDGAVTWLNSGPRSRASLRGKVVVIDFWTYGCINCLNALPNVKALAAKYESRGLIVIGVHTPEFAVEGNLDNVQHALRRLGVTYPVAVDNNHTIWNAFNNQYWPALYIVDQKGRIRYHHFGEGAYRETDEVVQQLLAQPGRRAANEDFSSVAKAAETAPETSPSKETSPSSWRID